MAVLEEFGGFLCSEASLSSCLSGPGREFGPVATCGNGASGFSCTGWCACAAGLRDCTIGCPPRVTLWSPTHSGPGCHYLHPDEWSCPPDPMLGGPCRFKPLVSGVAGLEKAEWNRGGPDRSLLLRHLDKHYSTLCPALQSEYSKKGNGFPPGAENPHGEIYHP